MAKSIIQSNSVIRENLKKRIEELDLTLQAIRDDASKRGMDINISSLSKYLNNSPMNNLTENQIMWLGYRYGIFTTLHVGVPKITEDKKITYFIPEYNEEICLKMLNKIFPPQPKKKKKVSNG